MQETAMNAQLDSPRDERAESQLHHRPKLHAVGL